MKACILLILPCMTFIGGYVLPASNLQPLNHSNRTVETAARFRLSYSERGGQKPRMHSHTLPYSAPSGLCNVIISIHFSCSRFMMQCSDSQATWRKQTDQRASVNLKRLNTETFCLTSHSQSFVPL